MARLQVYDSYVGIIGCEEVDDLKPQCLVTRHHPDPSSRTSFAAASMTPLILREYSLAYLAKLSYDLVMDTTTKRFTLSCTYLSSLSLSSRLYW